MARYSAGSKSASNSSNNTSDSTSTSTPHNSFYNSGNSFEVRTGSLRQTGKVLQFLLLAAAAVFIWLNVVPYHEIVQNFFAESSNLAIIEALTSIPLLGAVIGWVIAWLGGFLALVVAIVLWAILQILELLPRILMRDMDSIRLIIKGLERVNFLQIRDTDNEFIARLKHKHNELPMQWIRNAYWASAIAYISDFALCATHYPPINGGLERLDIFLAAPTWADVDGYNLTALLLTLFAVEIIVIVYSWLHNMLKHFSEVS
jgi:hypothetical protein